MILEELKKDNFETFWRKSKTKPSCKIPRSSEVAKQLKMYRLNRLFMAT
jgi:hypothetical protein